MGTQLFESYAFSAVSIWWEIQTNVFRVNINGIIGVHYCWVGKKNHLHTYIQVCTSEEACIPLFGSCVHTYVVHSMLVSVCLLYVFRLCS